MSATVVADQVQLTPSASALNFGNAVVGSAETQNETLTNAGNTDLTISSIAASGAGFSAAGGGSRVELAPGQNTQIAVTFDPTAIGAATGTLLVSSNASPLRIGLSGMGANTPVQHSVVLNWSPSTSTVTGYFVFRGDGVSGPLSILSTSIITTTTYRDTTVVSGQTYNYAVASVGAGSVESTFSNQVALTIPSP
jgi:Abnormal spindle-like microcephaly-assoc'd, ASPM-SPD-2-Hydin